MLFPNLINACRKEGFWAMECDGASLKTIDIIAGACVSVSIMRHLQGVSLSSPISEYVVVVRGENFRQSSVIHDPNQE